MKYICSHPKAKSYVTKACHVASWQKRPLTVQNENNKQAIANDSKQQIILHTRALRWCICFRGAKNNITLVYIETFLSPECNQSEKPVQRKLQDVENNEEATKKPQKKKRMTLTDGHEMYDTWIGHDVIHFCPCCGAAKSVSQDGTKVNRPIKLG